MATLLNCAECGGTVSSQAFQCPRCKTRYPLGVECIVCCKILKRSEAIKIKKEYGGAENRVSVKFFHPACHQQVNQVRLGKSRTSCPLCKFSIEFDISSFATCSNCGHNFSTNFKAPSFAPCCYCGFRLNKNLEVAVKEDSRPFLDGWITETVYAHRICYTPQRQVEERNSLRKDKLIAEQVRKERDELRRKQQVARKIETLWSSFLIGLVVGIVFGFSGIVANFIFKFGFYWKLVGFWAFGSAFIFTVVVVGIFRLLK